MCAKNIGHLVAASSVLTCNDFFCVKFYYRGFIEARHHNFLGLAMRKVVNILCFPFVFSDVAGADGGRGLQRAVAAAATTVAALKKRRRNISIKI